MLPTPRTSGIRETSSTIRQRMADGQPYEHRLEEAVALLPTPVVNDMGEGKTVERWDEWTADMKAKHSNGNGHGRSLAIEAQRLRTLPTPTVGDARNSRNATAERTPGGNHHEGMTLSDWAWLLPTPTARLGDASSRGADPARYQGPKSMNGRRSNLDDAIAAIEAGSPWLPGAPTSPQSDDGSES